MRHRSLVTGVFVWALLALSLGWSAEGGPAETGTAGPRAPGNWQQRFERISERLGQQREHWQKRLDKLHGEMVAKTTAHRDASGTADPAVARRKAFEVEWQRLVDASPRIKLLADSFVDWRKACAARNDAAVKAACASASARWLVLTADEKTQVERLCPGTGATIARMAAPAPAVASAP